MPLSPMFLAIILHFSIVQHSTALPLPSFQQTPQQNCPPQWTSLFLKADLCLKVFNKENYSNAVQTCIKLNSTLLNVAQFGNDEYKLMAENYLILPFKIYWVENDKHHEEEDCTEVIIVQNATSHRLQNLTKDGCDKIQNPFICQMKPPSVEIQTTTTEIMNAITIGRESTTTETSIPKNGTLAPSTNGCADEFEIQFYLEIQG